VNKPKGESEKIGCSINNPSGGITEKVITPQADGTYRVSYTPFEEGKHAIDVLYDNIPVPGSPFGVNVKRVSEPGRCRAYGPGLQKGIVSKPNSIPLRIPFGRI
jgi:filamin